MEGRKKSCETLLTSREGVRERRGIDGIYVVPPLIAVSRCCSLPPVATFPAERLGGYTGTWEDLRLMIEISCHLIYSLKIKKMILCRY
jgi:hypothetical protein